MDYNKLLCNKTAIITGAAMGIGRQIAITFAKQGAKVIAVDINEEKLRETMKFISDFSDDSKSYICNVGVYEEIIELINKIKNDNKFIDILVNCVGINERTLAHEIEEDVLDNILNVNFKSGYRLMKAFIPGMIEHGSGTIVNISSIHSIMTMPEHGAYAASKGAVNAMSRAIALDYAPYNIRINNIALGYILSDMNKIEVSHIENEDEKDRILTERYSHLQPLKAAKCEDVVNTALYLASDMSNYLTGQTICLDGGASIKAH